MGVGFSILALLATTMLLLCDSAWVFNGSAEKSGLRFSNQFLFSTSLMIPVLSVSISNTVIVVISTIFSVALHEFGHAVCAASEGLQIEYIAVFVAVLFPGALVSFSSDLLESLPRISALRVYCAGIWHNIMISAVCWIILILLPHLLSPLYIHDQGPIVLDVPQSSHLSGYLSPGDVILTVDGSYINSPGDWIQKFTQRSSYELDGSVHLDDFFLASHRNGYCVKKSWVTSSVSSQSINVQLSCPEEFFAFSNVLCSTGFPVSNRSVGGEVKNSEMKSCLVVKDTVKLKKCGDVLHLPEERKCSCQEDEYCMAPVLSYGTSWVEISYWSPYSLACSDSWEDDSPNPGSPSDPCGGTFIFIGNPLTLAFSINLSRYRPQRRYFFLGSRLPTLVEKILACTCHLSAALALLNSLPVFHLDGEPILEKVLSYITFLNSRQKKRLLWCCLAGGTLLTVISVSKSFYFIFGRQL